MITTMITFVCDGASNSKPCVHVFTQTGEKVSRRTTKVAAKKAGWQWKGRKIQLCPDHAFNKSKAVTAQAKKAEKAKAEKVVAKVVKAPAEKAIKTAPGYSAAQLKKNSIELNKAMGLVAKPTKFAGFPWRGVAKSAKKAAAVRK